ncbi:MAG TPA: hypothetical protein ENO11_01640 [Desulfobacteraceae bacterium]|nr:hypothetical protein [Desulfobacteraceae bacterium]
MKTFGIKMYMAMLFWAVALLPLAGCADKTTSTDEMSDLPPVSVFAGDLKDIELPVELEWERDKSMTIKTESFNGGIWHYEGRVEPLSLKDYIVNAMHTNKWKLVGESTSQDILLAFVKPNKTCMIVISESRLGKTRLTLYVTIDRTAAAGLNPFGEAVGQ